MVEVFDMFTVPLVKYSLPNWPENKKRILDALPELNSSHLDQGIDVYTDFFSEMENKDLPSYGEVVVDIIKPCLANFSDERRVEITDMWFQTAFKGNSHGLHNHGHSGWSSVIYVEFNPLNHLPTKFISPFNNPWNGNLVDYIPEVQEGDMIIFPANLPHEAEPNKSDERRTIISYNMRGHVDYVKKSMWEGLPIVRR